MVLDASAAVEAIDGHALSGEFGGWHSHAGLDIEFLAVLRRLTAHGDRTVSDARESLDFFLAMQITRHPVTRLLRRAWDMRHDITACDAAYVALAEALGVPLVTLDRKLATTARRYCEVIVP